MEELETQTEVATEEVVETVEETVATEESTSEVAEQIMTIAQGLSETASNYSIDLWFGTVEFKFTKPYSQFDGSNLQTEVVETTVEEALEDAGIAQE